MNSLRSRQSNVSSRLLLNLPFKSKAGKAVQIMPRRIIVHLNGRTKIFKWEGEDEQVQEIMYHRAWSHVWEGYANSQHFYCDHCDEWDLCEALDPGVLPNFDMDDKDDIDFIPPQEPSLDAPPPYLPTSPSPPQPFGGQAYLTNLIQYPYEVSFHHCR